MSQNTDHEQATPQLNLAPLEQVTARLDSAPIEIKPKNRIQGDAANNSLIGISEDNMIKAGAGDDYVDGGDGNDEIEGGKGYKDRLFGGNGDDVITDEDGVNGAHGGEGNDTINVVFAKDWDNNTNRFDAPRSDGKITGGYGDDIITVTMNDSRFFINLKGDEPVNTISDAPQDGNDTISLLGSYRTAIVDLGGGNDIFNGGMGSDQVSGSSGDDILNGGGGGDKLDGGSDDDLLCGGLGSDTLIGGEGRDRFVLTSGQGTDCIMDFQDGQDSLVLDKPLTFGQLSITQSNQDTLITQKHTGEVLAVLKGVQADLITRADFMIQVGTNVWK